MMERREQNALQILSGMMRQSHLQCLMIFAARFQQEGLWVALSTLRWRHNRMVHEAATSDQAKTLAELKETADPPYDSQPGLDLALVFGS
jgi:hypothetical protein